MKKVITIWFLFLLSGCSDETVFISGFELAWEKSIADLTTSQLQIISGNSGSDGSFIAVYRIESGQQAPEYLFIRFSADGKTRSTYQTPGNYLTELQSQPHGGFLVVLRSETDQNSFTQLLIDADLQVQQKSFQLSLPNTFHSLNFTTTHYFISEYEEPYPGVRIRKFKLDQSLEWSKRFTEPFIKPFPWLVENNLMIYRTNNEDSVAITSINATTGNITWSKYYQPGVLEDQLPSNGIFLPCFGCNNLNLTAYNYNNKKMVVAFLNATKGSVGRIISITLPDDIDGAYPSGLLSDGGAVLNSNHVGGTTVMKTDSKGNIGWRGNFVPGGRVFIADDQQLFVATPGIVYKLNPVFN